jgi:hypothetical protein
MARRDIVAARVRALIAGFDRYLTVYDAQPAFRPDQLAAHRQTIELRRRAGEFPAAVACFEDDLDALFAIHRVPVRHRIRVRTTNLAERSSVEETPAHQGHPAVHRRAVGDETGLRDNDPRRAALVPGLDQRPRTPSTQAAAR